MFKSNTQLSFKQKFNLRKNKLEINKSNITVYTKNIPQKFYWLHCMSYKILYFIDGKVL